jgi:hypothetical protein
VGQFLAKEAVIFRRRKSFLSGKKSFLIKEKCNLEEGAGFGREGKTGPNREGSKTFLSYLDRNEWCGKDGGAEDSGGFRI